MNIGQLEALSALEGDIEDFRETADRKGERAKAKHLLRSFKNDMKRIDDLHEYQVYQMIRVYEQRFKSLSHNH